MDKVKHDCAAIILCGDLNGGPGEMFHASLQKQGYRSAHRECHGREPEVRDPPLLPLCPAWRELPPCTLEAAYPRLALFPSLASFSPGPRDEHRTRYHTQ